MTPFTDQPLPAAPHIAVFSSSKIGNFVVITPLLRGLKEKYSDCTLDFFGSDLTQDFETHCPYIDWRFSLFSEQTDFLESLAKEVCDRRRVAGPYDLAINCDEYSEINLVMVTAIRPTYLAGAGLSPNFGKKLTNNNNPVQALLKDSDWNSEAFLARHRSVLTTNYIAEIFCCVAYVTTDCFKLELPHQAPDFSVPDVLVHVTATRPAKQWPVEYWQHIIRWCETNNLTVGLIGHKPEVQQKLYHSAGIEDTLLANTTLQDLRGRTSLTKLAGALKQAKLCITLDTGPLHIAAAVGCPTVAIFGNSQTGAGASPLKLWAPRQSHVKVTQSAISCTACEENKFKNLSCLKAQHLCMVQVTPEQVIEHMQGLLNTSKRSSESMRQDGPFTAQTLTPAAEYALHKQLAPAVALK